MHRLLPLQIVAGLRRLLRDPAVSEVAVRPARGGKGAGPQRGEPDRAALGHRRGGTPVPASGVGNRGSEHHSNRFLRGSVIGCGSLRSSQFALYVPCSFVRKLRSVRSVPHRAQADEIANLR